MHGVMQLARSGRKRKSGRRTASGDLARVAPAINYRALAALQPHRACLPKEFREDPKAATLLGKLNLVHREATPYGAEHGINDQQAEAGRQYAVAVGRYRASIDTPSGTAGAGKGYDCLPDGCREEPSLCECYNRRRRYNELYEALAIAGRKATMAVNDVAIRERPADIKHLRRGLDAVAKQIGLTAGRKSRHTGN